MGLVDRGSGPAGVCVSVIVDDEWRRRGLAAGISTLGGILTCSWCGTVSHHSEAASHHNDVILIGLDTPGELGSLRRNRRGGHSRDIVTWTASPVVLGVVERTDNPLLSVRAARRA